MEQLLCVKDVARVLNVAPLTANRMCRVGKIKAFRLNGAAWRVRKQDLEEYIRSQFSEPKRAANSRDAS